MQIIGLKFKHHWAMLFTLSIPSIFPMTSKWGCMEEELDNWKATALQVPVPGYLLDLGASNVHGYLALSHLGILIPALTQTKLCPEDKRLSAPPVLSSGGISSAGFRAGSW